MTEPLQPSCALRRLFEQFRGNSMKIATTLAIAAGLAGLAACNKAAQENSAANAALNDTGNVEMTANATNESMNVGNEANAVENNAGANTTANKTANGY
jgi:hypothetical protein